MGACSVPAPLFVEVQVCDLFRGTMSHDCSLTEVIVDRHIIYVMVPMSYEYFLTALAVHITTAFSSTAPTVIENKSLLH